MKDSRLIANIQFTAWPVILGAFLGIGLLLLLFIALRRYANKKDERDRVDEDNASQFSLSAIWDDKALDGLETAESYEAFKASQPVLRLKTSAKSPRLLEQSRGVASADMESTVIGSVLRLVRNGRYADVDDSVESNASDESQARETAVLGIRKSPDEENEQSVEDLFSDALSFIPISFSDSIAQFSPSKTHETILVPKRVTGDSADIGDVSLLKSCSSLSDIDESDNSLGDQ